MGAWQEGLVVAMYSHLPGNLVPCLALGIISQSPQFSVVDTTAALMAGVYVSPSVLQDRKHAYIQQGRVHGRLAHGQTLKVLAIVGH